MDKTAKRRAFGQHFLKDQSIAAKIANTAVEGAIQFQCPSLLEIGPGRGAITFPILEALPKAKNINRFVICERDRELAEFWKVRAQIHGLSSELKAEVHEADFLELDEEHWLSRAPIAVASNLPYSAGTAIAIKLAEHPDKIKIMVLMFQLEVAKRMRAEPGNKDWGSLSIWIQNRWDVKKLIAVPPQAFNPPPKVDSEVVVFTPLAEPRIPLPTPEARKLFESMLKVAFAHRRKMLRSGLPQSGKWLEALEKAGIDGTTRAEALGWEEWKRYYQALLALNQTSS